MTSPVLYLNTRHSRELVMGLLETYVETRGWLRDEEVCAVCQTSVPRYISPRYRLRWVVHKRIAICQQATPHGKWREVRRRKLQSWATEMLTKQAIAVGC